MFIKLEILKVHTSQNCCGTTKAQNSNANAAPYCQSFCCFTVRGAEISNGMAKGKVFIVLKRESRLEVGKQEDSIVG